MKLSDIFSNYFTVRQEMIDAVKNLTQAQLDWIPPNHSNSIGRLLTHIAETEHYWIRCVAEGRKEEPDFDAFENTHEIRAILALMQEEFDHFSQYLNVELVDDWDEVFYEFPAWTDRKDKRSKRWVVWHVVEHQARHRGQIFMMLRMQGLNVPYV